MKHKPIYRDEKQASEMRRETTGILQSAKHIADFWNGISIVPPMSREILNKLKKMDGTSFEDLLWEYILQENEAVHGKRYAATLNRSAHNLRELYDSKRMTGIMNGMTVMSDRYRYVTLDIVDFDENGEPMITGERIAYLEDRFAAYDTAENVRRYEVWHRADEALKELQALLGEIGFTGELLKFERGTGLVVDRPLLVFGKPQ